MSQNVEILLFYVYTYVALCDVYMQFYASVGAWMERIYMCILNVYISTMVSSASHAHWTHIHSTANVKHEYWAEISLCHHARTTRNSCQWTNEHQLCVVLPYFAEMLYIAIVRLCESAVTDVVPVMQTENRDIHGTFVTNAASKTHKHTERG